MAANDHLGGFLMIIDSAIQAKTDFSHDAARH